MRNGLDWEKKTKQYKSIKRMYLGKIRPLPLQQRVWCFLKSYSGIAMILGCICLSWAVLYKLVFLEIDAPWQWMSVLGDVFYAITLSVVASVIFYFITTYFPNKKRKVIIDRLILNWLQQLNWYGEMILGDIADCSYNKVLDKSKEEWIKTCDKRLSSKPLLGNLYILGPYYNNWFEYFQDKFHHEDTYIKNCRQYKDELPVQVLDIFEKLEIHDNLRNAVSEYKYQQDTKIKDKVIGEKVVDFDSMSNLSELIWNHCQNLRSLIETYQKNSYV